MRSMYNYSENVTHSSKIQEPNSICLAITGNSKPGSICLRKLLGKWNPVPTTLATCRTQFHSDQKCTQLVDDCTHTTVNLSSIEDTIRISAIARCVADDKTVVTILDGVWRHRTTHATQPVWLLTTHVEIIAGRRKPCMIFRLLL